jgi:rhamnulokinase
MMSVVAAVDIGATSGRVMLAELDAGVPRLREIHRFRNGPREVDGRWVWPFDSLCEEVILGLGKAVALGASSCGIDTWAVDYVVFTSEGKQVGPVYAYRDPAHARGIELTRQKLPRPRHYEISGIQELPFNTVYQLLAEDPSRISVDSRLLLVPDALEFMLTGEMGAELSNASTTALVDPVTRDWSLEVLESLTLPVEFFSPVHEPGRFRGLCRDVRLEKLPFISVATHDTASAFAGTPILDRDTSFIISLGTWALVGFETTEAKPQVAAADINLTHELGVDSTVRCLKNVTGMWLLEECRRFWEHTDGQLPDIPELFALAQNFTEFSGIVDVDRPELAAPGQTPDKILTYVVGLSPDTRAGLVRVLLESLTARLASQMCMIERFTGHIRPTVHIVGGSSRNGFLMQWIANASGKTVIAGPVEAACVGNAAVQWCAKGVFENISQARAAIALMPEIRTFEPNGSKNQWQDYARTLDWEIT